MCSDDKLIIISYLFGCSNLPHLKIDTSEERAGRLPHKKYGTNFKSQKQNYQVAYKQSKDIGLLFFLAFGP